ncbi:MAG: sodium:proton antiporter [Deltaproteobacteria bacterium]|jgi:multicomponent Na+:H+ antiporter subunit G|nr:sodium:proton antiporter [Deltaproteobacteria bacterium]MBC80068.1 sodium:proton antiporter [Gammaproteobacteria bacterium]|tara:strand:+ start:66 stop:386 length:321 start_codon:yes stop_codon:yes gene_type:complete
MIIDALSWFLLVSGSVFCIISAIGVLRLPDYFSRIHAAGILDSTGTGALILGLMLQGGFTLVTVKLLMILAIIVITGPTATHALARAALHGGLTPELDEEETSSNS